MDENQQPSRGQPDERVARGAIVRSLRSTWRPPAPALRSLFAHGDRPTPFALTSAFVAKESRGIAKADESYVAVALVRLRALRSLKHSPASIRALSDYRWIGHAAGATAPVETRTCQRPIAVLRAGRGKTGRRRL